MILTNPLPSPFSCAVPLISLFTTLLPPFSLFFHLSSSSHQARRWRPLSQCTTDTCFKAVSSVLLLAATTSLAKARRFWTIRRSRSFLLTWSVPKNRPYSREDSALLRKRRICPKSPSLITITCRSLLWRWGLVYHRSFTSWYSHSEQWS